jgi:hypothetical protein
MGTYLKQSEVAGKKKKRESQKPRTTSDYRDSQSVARAIDGFASIVSTYVTDARNGEHHDYTGLSEIATQLEAIHNSLRSYNENTTNGENKLAIFTGPEGSGYHPILIALDPSSETTENILEVAGRIATAFERIADAMAGPTPTQGEGEVKS